MKKTLTIIMISLVTTFVFAQDSEDTSTQSQDSPALETVCDPLMDATKGLYGLCVAYCEAQDAPTEIEEGADIATLDFKTPHKKLLENYEKRMKENDPRMPCVNYVSSCPLFSKEELAEIGTHGWYHKSDRVVNNDYYEIYQDRESAGRGYNHFAYIRKNKREVPVTYQGIYHYRNRDISTTYTRRVMPLTESEFEGCKQQIINHVVNPL